VTHALKEAMTAFRRAPLLTALSAAMVALALFVLGLFSVAAWNLRLALETMEERVEVVAYLRDDAGSAQVDLLVDELRRLPEVEGVLYVSRSEALDRARQELPEFTELFTDLEVNPLPASVEVTLRSGRRNPESVESVAREAEAFGIVEEVRYGREWVQRLFLIRRIGAMTAGILGGGFALVAALIIGTAIRIAIFARRDEILIMRLVGATNGFIRRPFLLEGALTGLAGGVLALLLTLAAHGVVSSLLFEIDWIPVAWGVIGVLAGGALGTVASLLAVRRYLREV
jgi:cell division transport system permease protein